MKPVNFTPKNFMTKSQINEMIGRRNKKAGEAFENMITASCEYYKIRSIAFIEKTPEPFRILGKIEENGRPIFKGTFAKKGQPDFKGTMRGGTAICFEAKHTEHDRIEQKAVTNEQGNCLDVHHSLGAETFVVVSLMMRDFYRVPWTVWKDMKTLYGHKYMDKNELEPYRVPFDGSVKFLDGLNWGQ